jgi:hypothetical protein
VGRVSAVREEERRLSLSTGWRLTTSLVALAAVMGMLVALIAGGRDDPRLPSSIGRPWMTCLQEVQRQLPPLRDTEIVGPTESVWEPSGEAVEVLGALRHNGQRDRPFACRVVLLGKRWSVDRVVFGR